MLYSSKRSPYWFCYKFSLALNYFVEKPQEQKKSPTEKIVSKSFSRSNQSHQPWQMYESVALWREENGAHSRAALIRVNSIRFSSVHLWQPSSILYSRRHVLFFRRRVYTKCPMRFQQIDETVYLLDFHFFVARCYGLFNKLERKLN